jgi:hypothetical protein
LTAKAEVSQSTLGFYLGVDAAFGDVAQTEQLIDNVSSYTNFFVIGCEQQIGENGSFGVYNETRLTVISQYVYNKGMNFIVYSDDPTYPSKQWIVNATENYGGRFMGIYYLDEPGGKQLDHAKWMPVTSAENFANAADQYVNKLKSATVAITNSFEYPTQYPLYTSDYGLYWYDYAGGYNTVFAELGLNSGNENYSRQLALALCRGAATAFNQNWGAMITYATTKAPYMENSTQLYGDMLLAYENGAKYIVVFDSNPSFTKSILDTTQLGAIEQFWQYAKTNPRTVSQPSDRSAYVLPQDFGYSFRSPNDTVWGLWNANWDGTTSLAFVADVSMCIVTFIQMFGTKLDIIYPIIDGTVQSIRYQNVIYWNETSLVPNMPSMPAASYAAVHSDTSQPYDAKEIELYAGLTALAVVVLIAVVVVSFRRRNAPA